MGRWAGSIEVTKTCTTPTAPTAGYHHAASSRESGRLWSGRIWASIRGRRTHMSCPGGHRRTPGSWSRPKCRGWFIRSRRQRPTRRGSPGLVPGPGPTTRLPRARLIEDDTKIFRSKRGSRRWISRPWSCSRRSSSSACGQHFRSAAGWPIVCRARSPPCRLRRPVSGSYGRHLPGLWRPGARMSLRRGLRGDHPDRMSQCRQN